MVCFGFSLYLTLLCNLFQAYHVFTATEPNSVSMFWIIPQFVVMTLGEVMYSVTGLEFSYSQSPESMKSVIQSAWLLTVGVGNLIVVIITGARFFDSQVSDEEGRKIWKKVMGESLEDFAYGISFFLLSGL